MPRTSMDGVPIRRYRPGIAGRGPERRSPDRSMEDGRVDRLAEIGEPGVGDGPSHDRRGPPDAVGIGWPVDAVMGERRVVIVL